jgi:hypothetical protein
MLYRECTQENISINFWIPPVRREDGKGGLGYFFFDKKYFNGSPLRGKQ